MNLLAKIQYLKDTSGATLIEFSLLLSFLLLATFGILEGGYIYYQVNGAQKATQIAARYAATRPPVAIGMDECVSSGGTIGLNAGTDCSTLANFAKIECQYTGTSTGTCDNGNFMPIRDQMKSVFPFIKDENIFITYEGTGLGYVGRGKPVPAITVELRNISYNYIVVGSILKVAGDLSGRGNTDIGTTFNISNIQTTVIGEDIGEGA